MLTCRRMLFTTAVFIASTATSSRGAQPETLIQPFDPPTLAELDAAGWVDKPVVDALELLRAHLATQPKLATVQEAMRLQNTSADANAKILSVISRLPDNDSQVNWTSTWNRHLLGDIKTTNQILQSTVQEVDVVTFLGLGLFGFDWDLKPFAVNESVVSWQTSKDRMCDKVVIRDDLTWSDGRPLTAHDVVFSFQTIMNPQVPVPAMRSMTDKLRWVEAYDDHTLVFFQKEPLATNDWNLNFGIIPRHIYENSPKEDVTLAQSPYHVQYENAPVCGGPYVITRRSRGQEILLTARESWYMHNGKQVRQRPYFQQIRFRIIEDPNTALLALKSGQIDELELQAPQWKNQTTGPDYYKLNTKANGVEWLYFYFGWNCKSPFFSDVRVRQAMSFAFDHDEMLNTLCYGLYEPATGIWHAQSWMAPKKPTPRYRQDLDRAEDLLDKAGWQDHDGDGTRDKMIGGRLVPFKFSLLVRQDPERVRICELLKTNLDQIGIECNIAPMEATVLQQRMLDHNFQASYGGWSTGADPDTAENIWGTGQERNFVQYANPEVDRLFDQGRKEYDRAKRGEIYARMHQLIYADQPYTFLYYRKSFYGFSKELRGINFSPRGPYHYTPGMSGIWKVVN